MLDFSWIVGTLSFLNTGFIRPPSLEAVYVTIENPAFCLTLYLTGVHFRGGLQNVGHALSKKSSVNQSKLEKSWVPDCKTNYIIL